MIQLEGQKLKGLHGFGKIIFHADLVSAPIQYYMFAWDLMIATLEELIIYFVIRRAFASSGSAGAWMSCCDTGQSSA
jgi:hypothetical protein